MMEMFFMPVVIDRLSYSMSLLTFNCWFGDDLIAVELSIRSSETIKRHILWRRIWNIFKHIPRSQY